MADALAWLLAARFLILDTRELEEKGPENPALAEGLPGLVQFYEDLCHVQAAQTAGEVGRICSELVFGYNRHPAWETTGETCYQIEELDELGHHVEELIEEMSGPGNGHATHGRHGYG